jgi:hypothetical protein
MKNLLIAFITVISMLFSCQSKTAKTLGVTEVKSCVADSTKSCCLKSEKKTGCPYLTSISTNGVQVIYFHNERRCATCMAVEEGASEVVKQFADTSITFHSYLFGDPQTAETEKKFDIEGQTLLIVGKGQVIDVTNMAFMNALVKPGTYKDELKKQIDKLK